MIFFRSWYVRKVALSTYSLGTRVSTTLQSRSRVGFGSSTYKTFMYEIQIRHTLVCWNPLSIANKNHIGLFVFIKVMVLAPPTSYIIQFAQMNPVKFLSQCYTWQGPPALPSYGIARVSNHLS